MGSAAKMKTLAQCREDIDRIDREIVRLFEERMAVCRDVAAYKIAHGLPVLDRTREEAVLQARRALLTDDALVEGVTALFECIMAASRGEQQKMMDASGEGHA